MIAHRNHLLPHGGYDIKTLSGDLRLTFAQGNEPFQPLGSSDPSADKTKKGEVIYVDDARVLTRAWNYRDCEPTKIAADRTTEFLLIIDDTNGHDEGPVNLSKAVEDLKGLYETVFGKAGEDGGCFRGQAAVWKFHEGKTEEEISW